MCGINGFNFLDRKLAKKMNNSLTHRGPNASGIYSDERVTLGQRRLSIIDLSRNGAQPMSYIHKGRKITITFNGEIYNFFEIKRELKKIGYKFNSETDTEVILASYMEWGTQCVEKFNGMWAFCIYDPKKNILFLSRDRVGKKPLYYYFHNGMFIFSSEVKGILQHGLKKELSKESIDLYFSLGFIPSPYSIYKGIQKLDQRQNLVLNLKNNQIKKEYYYHWPTFNPMKDKQSLKNEFNDIFLDSVRLRMVSDVPLGAFLSGGLDSSTVVNFAKKYNKNINTYSMGFDGEFDETPMIKILEKKFNVNHSHIYFRREDFENSLKDIFYFYDEPFSDISMFPTRMLSELAKKEITVALSGDGGDEIFGGYPRYKMAYQMELMRKVPAFIRKAIYKISTNRLREGIRLSLLPKESFYSEARNNYYKPRIVKKILSKKLKGTLERTNSNLVEAVRLMDIEFYTLPDNFLTKVDRASMANSLEIRCPLLDYRLIEYSMRLPTKYKVSTKGEKIFFKEIVSQFLPKKIIRGKKKGFTPPIGKWMGSKEHIAKIEKYLEELYSKNIISTEWNNFYKKEIMPNNNLISNNYKTRLFLFYNWCKYWDII